MKIAICDDEPCICSKMEEYLQKFSPELNYKVFLSAKELLQDTQHTFFDIIFMDIEMNAPNGYEAAVELMQREDRPLIIFVTNSGDYTIRGYGVAFRYIKKPITYGEFCRVLEVAIKHAVPKKIAFPIGGGTRLVSLGEVAYFEIYGHSLKIHTKECTYTCRMTLSAILDQLDGTDFAQPHKSYLVNLGYIDYVSGKEITMLNGDTIPISAPRKSDFSTKFKLYIRG